MKAEKGLIEWFRKRVQISDSDVEHLEFILEQNKLNTLDELPRQVKPSKADMADFVSIFYHNLHRHTITRSDIHDAIEEFARRFPSNAVDTSKVNRVEVIDESGRDYVNWNEGNKVELQLQDQNRTLKIFITEKNKK